MISVDGTNIVALDYCSVYVQESILKKKFFILILYWKFLDTNEIQYINILKLWNLKTIH